MKGSKFVFNYVHLLYYKCHKIDPNRGGSYIDSVTVALNHEEIKKIGKKSEKHDSKKFEKNNLTIAQIVKSTLSDRRKAKSEGQRLIEITLL